MIYPKKHQKDIGLFLWFDLMIEPKRPCSAELKRFSIMLNLRDLPKFF